ncbi:ATP-binding protein [Pseudomonas coleopterorum]|uniref:histidine kinase n=1 Tax=Pseudomonas coleopterorum TaxID=1605838 RepID=A0ABR9C141_9PSED|nr:ATP-binding protein [Pseudomonas coleopterorum]MBD8753689.1 response regulator [Pseudomonas coleopterorum]MBD8771009.1 response regulator [Pseudomonas coleopterorum]
MLELALKKAEQGMLDKPALEVASQSANGLLALIGDILDVTRIEAGRLELLPAPCQLGQLANETVGLFLAQAREKHLRLKLDMLGAPDTWLSVDPVRFKQIIANLLSNAIKFTREGQVTVVLGVWPQARGARVELSVEDTGQGIAQTDLARLGAPYRQAAGGRGSRVGAGLGLSICRSLAALMQGRLELHSVLGCGTRVQVQFDAVPGAAAPRQTARETSRSRLPALQVLVVDDYPANRVLLERQLTFLGHRVTVAEHGAAGLRAWLRGAYDVVISDCNMPGINGYQLVKAVREHERRKHLEPCLFLGCTANAQIRERLRCLQQGMDDCLFKPLSLESLALHLDPHRARRQAETQEHEVDLGSLDQLTGGDAISLQRLLDDLADSNLQDLKRLQSLTQPYAIGEVAELVHRIKGGARIVRARRLLAACEALEQACTASPSGERMRRGVDDLASAMVSLDEYLIRHERSGKA